MAQSFCLSLSSLNHSLGFSWLHTGLHVLGSAWVVKGTSPGKGTGWISGMLRIAMLLSNLALHLCFVQFSFALISIHSRNILERVFITFVIVSLLRVMGSSVSKMSAAIAQMNMASSEKSRTECQVNTCLRVQRVSVTLAVRTARFVGHSLEHRGM